MTTSLLNSKIEGMKMEITDAYLAKEHIVTTLESSRRQHNLEIDDFKSREMHLQMELKDLQNEKCTLKEGILKIREDKGKCMTKVFTKMLQNIFNKSTATFMSLKAT